MKIARGGGDVRVADDGSDKQTYLVRTLSFGTHTPQTRESLFL